MTVLEFPDPLGALDGPEFAEVPQTPNSFYNTPWGQGEVTSESLGASASPNPFAGLPGDPEPFEAPAVFELARSRNVTVDIPSPLLVTPRSRHAGFNPPYTPTAEEDVLRMLDVTTSAPSQGDAGYVELELDQFSFYTDSTKQWQSFSEMRSLFYMSIKQLHGTLYFDGILRDGDAKCYVERVPINELPIANYGKQFSSVKGQIWVRSTFNSSRKREIYYRLNKPTAEYRRFYTPFLWVADLAKHVVDYAEDMISQRRDVSLSSFQANFVTWLRRTYPNHGKVQRWLAQHPSSDFRLSVSANIDFIYKEMPQHPTIVTPYIKECFKDMGFGTLLRVPGEDPSHPVSDNQPSRDPRLPPADTLKMDEVIQVKVEYVISTPRDDGQMTDTKWMPAVSKHSIDDGRWFGLVQKGHISKCGKRSFDVTWLYRPADTLCSVMKYPWPTELFLSDHCTCEEPATSRIQGDEILAVHPINWFGSPNDRDDRLFIRQLYMVEERRWITLKEAHRRCSHRRSNIGLKARDTILATFDLRDEQSEPFEVVKVFRQETKPIFVRLRELLRRNTVEPSASHAANELVYTERLKVVKFKDIRFFKKCHIRFFNTDEPIPCPYNRGGTGNLFYITHRLDRSLCIPMGEPPASFQQGFDPEQELPKLKGLDLFCGAGNFGRGLEEGGVVEMRWANDIWDRAIHTYMANTSHGQTHPFLGSVDDLLHAAMKGKFSESVPRPGEVDFISGDSPCPRFSLLTHDKTTLAQRKRQSMVASFAAFVDFYRPKYGILENVVSIVPSKKELTQNVMSQLLGALVGMGYQTQLILGEAWGYGAPQSRSRVFLYFAQQGLQLPEAPLPSHSHYPGIRPRFIGYLPNGECFTQREFKPTAFKFTTAAEATADLPPIFDARPDCCIPFPEHRLIVTTLIREQFKIAAIPMHPFGMNFVKAWNQGRGVMSQADRELFNQEGSFSVRPESKSYGRLHPHGVFPTIITTMDPGDAITGQCSHWAENRQISLMEARRAQGFPDEEVLLGGTEDRYTLVGNSVARQVALALGLQFREAWVGSLADEAGFKLVRHLVPLGTPSTAERYTLEVLDGHDFGIGVAISGRASRGDRVDADDSCIPCERGRRTTTRDEEAAVRCLLEPISRQRRMSSVSSSASSGTAGRSEDATGLTSRSPTPEMNRSGASGPTIVWFDAVAE